MNQVNFRGILFAHREKTEVFEPVLHPDVRLLFQLQGYFYLSQSMYILLSK